MDLSNHHDLGVINDYRRVTHAQDGQCCVVWRHVAQHSGSIAPEVEAFKRKHSTGGVLGDTSKREHPREACV